MLMAAAAGAAMRARLMGVWVVVGAAPSRMMLPRRGESVAVVAAAAAAAAARMRPPRPRCRAWVRVAPRLRLLLMRAPRLS
jgi:hypothetical protein